MELLTTLHIPNVHKKNAILLINRQIERFNAMNEVRLPLYGQKQRKPKGTSDKMKKGWQNSNDEVLG